MYIYIYIPGFVWWSWYVPVVGASAVQLLPVPPPVQAEEVEGLEQGTDHVPAEHVPGEHANSRSYVFIYIYISWELSVQIWLYRKSQVVPPALYLGGQIF